MQKTFTDKLRAWPWLALALIITVLVGVIAPHQLGVLAWSLSKLAFGAYLGYWIDRSIFHYARPGDLSEFERHVASLRRAVIIGAAILALGLGV